MGGAGIAILFGLRAGWAEIALENKMSQGE
jgi:hypothetical protein